MSVEVGQDASAASSSRDRLIVGLDVGTRAEAEALVETLGDDVLWYKIGYQLAYGDGLPLVRALADSGKKVFLDLKLLDIPNTVAKGVESALALGAAMLTVHAYPHAMKAAVESAQGADLTLLGVTVLTSLDDDDLHAAGYGLSVEKLVTQRAKQASEFGMGGIVSSAAEARPIRRIVGPDMAVVTPGIRPSGSQTGDQKRIMTPADALDAGASHLVVARPIISAADPQSAARAILAEMSQATGSR